MLRPNILIFSAPQDQESGSKIKHLIECDTTLNVKQVCGRLNKAESGQGVPPQLLIAIVPTTREETAAFLRELNSLDVRTSVMTVVRADGPTDGLEKSHDFMFTPLQESEVLLRVRRLLNASHRNTAINGATGVCGLAQILGEDP